MFTKEFLKSKVKNFDFRLREDKVVCYTKEEFFEVLHYRINLIEKKLPTITCPNQVYISFTLSNEKDQDISYSYGFRTYSRDYLDMLVALFKGIETRGFEIEIHQINIHEVSEKIRMKRHLQMMEIDRKIMESLIKRK